MDEGIRLSTILKLVLGGVIALLVLSLGMCSAETVNTGQRGITVEYGRPTGTLGEGLHFVNPFTTSIVELSVRQLKWNAETVAYTKDVQQADVKFTVTYSLNPDKVMWVYRNVGEDWAAQIIPQVAYQAIKDVFGQSEAVKDTINSRATVQERIQRELARRLAARNINVHSFELTDISFSDAFENAVEAKQVAVENANAERNKTVAVQERANQAVITAKAQAEAMRIKSEALSANPGLTAYEYAVRWNGVMPTTIVGSDTPLFMQR